MDVLNQCPAREMFSMMRLQSEYMFSLFFSSSFNCDAAMHIAAKYCFAIRAYYSINPCYQQLPYSLMIGVFHVYISWSHQLDTNKNKAINRASNRKTKRKFLFFHLFIRFSTLFFLYYYIFSQPLNPLRTKYIVIEK